MPCPKQKRISLSPKKRLELKRDKWEAQGMICPRCQLYISWEDANLCHFKSVGSGGDDTWENTDVRHWECHIEEDHSPKWSKKIKED